MRYKLFFLSIIGVELFLRFFFPNLASDIFSLEAVPLESPFIYNQEIGYELKPHALIRIGVMNNFCFERLNSYGFRGPEYKIPKPGNVFRILAVGDSLVQQQELSYTDTWEQVLERMLNKKNSNLTYEVINAGIGGYVCWQVKQRLKNKGILYQPDMVIVIVGKNDMVYSMLPYWKPGLNLADIESSYERKNQPSRIGFFKKMRLFIYRYCYIMRMVRNIFNSLGDLMYRARIILKHQKDSNIPFNQEALNLYLENLEDIYTIIKENKSRMVLVIWPTILTEKTISYPKVHRKLFLLYQHFPISTKELFLWNKRYIQAQRDFYKKHPDIILIDGDHAFQNKGVYERISLFRDFVHMGKEGNIIIADLIYDNLKRYLGIDRYEINLYPASR
ncbi:MAG: GDSL-type esterase/lipase family protein [Candidatus Omnitrophica bacterium]|nr:GDSL-type esterase/lipase family protein [Candidatus Omnitrophota bacterium]MCM8799964.1 GDSL-type esterase/lipase family protein [Candidatus Omnitrophota bacterium]